MTRHGKAVPAYRVDVSGRSTVTFPRLGDGKTPGITSTLRHPVARKYPESLTQWTSVDVVPNFFCSARALCVSSWPQVILDTYEWDTRSGTFAQPLSPVGTAVPSGGCLGLEGGRLPGTIVPSGTRSEVTP